MVGKVSEQAAKLMREIYGVTTGVPIKMPHRKARELAFELASYAGDDNRRGDDFWAVGALINAVIALATAEPEEVSPAVGADYEARWRSLADAIRKQEAYCRDQASVLMKYRDLGRAQDYESHANAYIGVLSLMGEKTIEQQEEMDHLSSMLRSVQNARDAEGADKGVPPSSD